MFDRAGRSTAATSLCEHKHANEQQQFGDATAKQYTGIQCAQPVSVAHSEELQCQP